MIDIGGTALLRSAAKNYKYVTTVSNPSDYKNLINNMKQNGQTTLEFRRKMASKVFSTISKWQSPFISIGVGKQTKIMLQLSFIYSIVLLHNLTCKSKVSTL